MGFLFSKPLAHHLAAPAPSPAPVPAPVPAPAAPENKRRPVVISDTERMEVGLNVFRLELQRKRGRLQTDAANLRRLGAEADAGGDEATARKQLRRALVAEFQAGELEQRLAEVERQRDQIHALADKIEEAERAKAMNEFFAKAKAAQLVEQLEEAEAQKVEAYAYFDRLESAVAASNAESARIAERNRATDLAARRELAAIREGRAATAAAPTAAAAAAGAAAAPAARPAEAATAGAGLQLAPVPTEQLDVAAARAANAEAAAAAAAAAAADGRGREERVALPA